MKQKLKRSDKNILELSMDKKLLNSANCCLINNKFSLISVNLLELTDTIIKSI